MMDAKPLLREMFHPQLPPQTLPDRPKDARLHTRTARPVRYYFTDFARSKRYSTHSGTDTETAPSELPILGGDRTVPEFRRSHRTRCNPYHTDVYCMGNLIRGDFLQVRGLTFLVELFGEAVVTDIADRTLADVHELRVHGASDRPYGPGRTWQTSNHGRGRGRVARCRVQAVGMEAPRAACRAAGRVRRRRAESLPSPVRSRDT